jgi:putative acetyltransferase
MPLGINGECMTAHLVNRAVSDADISAVKSLFIEYASEAGFELDVEGPDHDFEDLPGKYQPPHGGLYLCRVAGSPAGCVGITRLEMHTCEVKRLFVRPAMRRQGIGRALMSKAIKEAQSLDYKKAVLNTLATQTEAKALYQSLGFFEFAGCTNDKSPNVIWMEIYI